jgi:integral membrane protein
VTARFRLVAYVEAATYLVLLAAVVLLRVFDGPDFVGIMGPIHGVVFLVYFVLVLKVRESQAWGFWRTIVVLIAAALPFGGFSVGRHLVDDPTPATR